MREHGLGFEHLGLNPETSRCDNFSSSISLCDMIEAKRTRKNGTSNTRFVWLGIRSQLCNYLILLALPQISALMKH